MSFILLDSRTQANIFFVDFQTMPNEDLYTFASVWTNYKNIFTILIAVSPKNMLSECSDRFLKCLKTLLSQLLFMYGNKKKSFGDKSELYGQWQMRLFGPMCESSHCRGEKCSILVDWFFLFLERQLAIKSWVTLRINCTVLLRFQCSQKTRWPFTWKCFMREQVLLDLANLEIPLH